MPAQLPKHSGNSVTSHPAHALLARAHSPETATQLFTEKIIQRPLLLRASSPPPLADKRALRRHIRLKKKSYYLRKQKPKPLSAKEKREFGVHDLPKEVSYDVYKGLNNLWRAYMNEVLGIDNLKARHVKKVEITAASHGSLLASADFHGAEVEVVKSGCAGRVGTKGIVVRDTKFTFVIVCPGNKVRRIPKAGCVFRVVLPLDEEVEGEEGWGKDGTRKHIVFEIDGNQFQVRPAERANKKFKWNWKDYL